MQEAFTIDHTHNFKKTQHEASIQKLINLFVFFLAFPALNILGNSITFYIFILILFKVGSYWKKRFTGKKLFFLSIIVLFSTYQMRTFI